MSKARQVIPAKIRENVLREFNHRCAMCGTGKPHVHHIDENPTNNDPLNLLPLCPNCHLTDQHNPTTKLQPERLKLFRAHKDPMILTPQFAPLFRRMRFLENVSESQDVSELQASAGELCRFVSALNMGKFYSEQLDKLMKYPSHVYSVRLGGPDPEYKALVRLHHHQYREQIRRVRDEVYTLVVELLRYQDLWKDRTDRN